MNTHSNSSTQNTSNTTLVKFDHSNSSAHSASPNQVFDPADQLVSDLEAMTIHKPQNTESHRMSRVLSWDNFNRQYSSDTIRNGNRDSNELLNEWDKEFLVKGPTSLEEALILMKNYLKNGEPKGRVFEFFCQRYSFDPNNKNRILTRDDYVQAYASYYQNMRQCILATENGDKLLMLVDADNQLSNVSFDSHDTVVLIEDEETETLDEVFLSSIKKYKSFFALDDPLITGPNFIRLSRRMIILNKDRSNLYELSFRIGEMIVSCANSNGFLTVSGKTELMRMLHIENSIETNKLISEAMFKIVNIVSDRKFDSIGNSFMKYIRDQITLLVRQKKIFLIYALIFNSLEKSVLSQCFRLVVGALERVTTYESTLDRTQKVKKDTRALTDRLNKRNNRKNGNDSDEKALLVRRNRSRGE